MIDEINKEIEKFLSSILNNKKNISSIIKKSSTSISDDLKKGHITSNVCMVAASILKLNPKNLAEDLKTRLEKDGQAVPITAMDKYGKAINKCKKIFNL